MIISDFGKTAKRLLPLYLFLLAFQILLGKAARIYNIIFIIGLICTLAVNLSMFWNDYLGKNAVMINMLPLGGGIKVFSKLLWGFMFSALFLGLLTFIAYGTGAFMIAPSDFIRVMLLYLSCYAAMIVSKPWGRWYYVFGLMILFSVITSIAGFPAYIYGELAAAITYGIICLIIFLYCAFNIGR